MPKVPPPECPKETSSREILARVQKAVTSHYHTIAQEFENFDTLKSNTVSRDEFRSICTRHVQILTDEQVRVCRPHPKQVSEQTALHCALLKVISSLPLLFSSSFSFLTLPFLFLSPS